MPRHWNNRAMVRAIKALEYDVSKCTSAKSGSKTLLHASATSSGTDSSSAGQGQGQGQGLDGWEDEDAPQKMKVAKKNLLMQLFHDSGPAKLPSVEKMLGTFLDNKLSGKVHSLSRGTSLPLVTMQCQVLVFAHHRSVLDGIAAFLKSRGEAFIRIDGRTSSRERHARVEQFQSDSGHLT
jgi:SNF2 family DNA or RNA helicase